MKKHLVIAAGLAVLSTSAFATISRESALGTSTSIWNSDTRSAFQNPSSINTMNNYVVTEVGATSTDAEGGFMRSSGSFVYGLYLNHNQSQGDTTKAVTGNVISSGAVGSASGVAAGVDEKNGVDLFFGGDMGVQWGARLHYNNTNATAGTTALNTMEDTYNGLGLGLGMTMGDIEAYANLILTDEYVNNTAATANKTTTGGGMTVGASYGMGNWKFFFDLDKDTVEWTETAASAAVATAADKYEKTSMSIGAGHTHEVSSSARILTTIALETTGEKATDLSSATAVTTEVDTTSIPVTIAFEADANSWLTLRGSLRQSINGSGEYKSSVTGHTNTEKGNTSNTTAVAVGATLNFGKLKVDGMIMDGSNANNTHGDVALDNVLTKVAVHYWF